MDVSGQASDTSALESEIDHFVYQHYGQTNNEVKKPYISV